MLWSSCEQIKSGIPALLQVSTAERKEEERKTCKVRKQRHSNPLLLKRWNVVYCSVSAYITPAERCGRYTCHDCTAVLERGRSRVRKTQSKPAHIQAECWDLIEIYRAGDYIRHTWGDRRCTSSPIYNVHDESWGPSQHSVTLDWSLSHQKQATTHTLK